MKKILLALICLAFTVPAFAGEGDKPVAGGEEETISATYDIVRFRGIHYFLPTNTDANNPFRATLTCMLCRDNAGTIECSTNPAHTYVCEYTGAEAVAILNGGKSAIYDKMGDCSGKTLQ